MKLNHPMFAQMRAATQNLLAKGPAAATAAIQQALGGLRHTAAGKTAAPAGATINERSDATIDATFDARTGEPGAAASPAPAMRDINPPPAGASPRAAPETDSGSAAPSAAGAPGAAVNAHGLAQDLMTRMGMTPEMQANLHAHLPAGLKNFDLPAFDLSGLDLNTPHRSAKPPLDVPPGAQFLSGAYRNHAGSRNYKLYIPSGYHGQAMPLLVMLHGCTQDPDDFAAGTRMNAVAEERQCLVVYPEQTKSANNSKCWNWFNAIDQQHGQGEPSLIAGIAQQVIDEYPVTPRQVYVAGLSAGGAMAVIVGTLYPDLFAAVGVHSGLPYASAKDLPSALSAMKRGAAATHAPSSKGGLPIIVFHGDHDKVVHPRNGEQVMAQRPNDDAGAPAVQSGGVPNGHRYTQTTHRRTDGKPLAEHWVIHGAGHAWSGGDARGSYTDQQGPDASREMMRFFKTVS